MDSTYTRGQRIEIARLSVGLSQKQLVELVAEKNLAAVTRSQWSRLESDQLAVSPDALLVCHEILGKSADWILFGKEIEQPPIEIGISPESYAIATDIDNLDEDMRAMVTSYVHQIKHLSDERRALRENQAAMEEELDLKDKARADTSSGNYIYFIAAPEASRIKIGYTTKPEKRISSLMTSSAYQLDTILVIEGSREQEQAYHQRFAHLREHREWFTDTPELREFILALK